MTVDQSKLSFWSGANYMKRDSSTDSATMTLGASGATTSLVISHSLGFIPFFDVSAEVDTTDTLWAGEKVNIYTDTSLSGVSPVDPQLLFWCDTTKLTIQLINNTSPTATGTRLVEWVIYKDYGNM